MVANVLKALKKNIAISLSAVMENINLFHVFFHNSLEVKDIQEKSLIVTVVLTGVKVLIPLFLIE